MTYTVYYKRPFGLRVKLKNITGDGFVNGQPCRYFAKQSGEIVYISSAWEVTFSKEREQTVRQKIRREAGQ
jgi:succinate dehydrogenase/fumarate reductase flavoprotein subunit